MFDVDATSWEVVSTKPSNESSTTSPIVSTSSYCLPLPECMKICCGEAGDDEKRKPGFCGISCNCTSPPLEDRLHAACISACCATVDPMLFKQSWVGCCPYTNTLSSSRHVASSEGASISLRNTTLLNSGTPTIAADTYIRHSPSTALSALDSLESASGFISTSDKCAKTISSFGQFSVSTASFANQTLLGTPTASPDADKVSISKATVIGIGVGCAIIAIALVGILIFCFKISKHKHKHESLPQAEAERKHTPPLSPAPPCREHDVRARSPVSPMSVQCIGQATSEVSYTPLEELSDDAAPNLGQYR